MSQDGHEDRHDDSDILARVSRLVAEERALAGDAESAPERQARRRQLEEQLDQCWDLLRQRQARREFGEDPAAAQVRPAGEVEHYLQ